MEKNRLLEEKVYFSINLSLEVVLFSISAAASPFWSFGQKDQQLKKALFLTGCLLPPGNGLKEQVALHRFFFFFWWGRSRGASGLCRVCFVLVDIQNTATAWRFQSSWHKQFKSNCQHIHKTVSMSKYWFYNCTAQAY